MVRVLRQEERYNVTTTNYLPRTWQQIAALQSLAAPDRPPLFGRAGWEVLEQLHAAGVTPRIPIIVTSTDPHTLQRMEQDYDRYGGDKLVAKPLDIDVLLEAIRTLIGPA